MFMNSNTYNNMKTISFLFIISLFINGVVTDSVTVNEGYSVTLHTNIIIQSNDVIEWRYEDDLIAKLDRDSISLFSGSDGRFTDRLNINNQTGDLTITDVSYVIGEYHLQITGEKTTRKTFNIGGQIGFGGGVTSFSVMEGDSVSLSSGSPDYNKYDVIHWRFNNSSLVDFNRKTRNISTHDGRFKDRLKLDQWFGDLFISNITTDLSGLYQVNVDSNSGTHTIHQSYTVTVTGDTSEVKTLSVMEGDSVTLHTDKQIQKYDDIDWTFGPQKSRLAAVAFGNFKIYGERFKDRLQVDDQTGSLTIVNITTEDPGLYQLKIINYKSNQSIRKRFIVSVSARDLSSGVIAGICVGILLVIAAAAVVFYRHHRSSKSRTQEDHNRGKDSVDINLPLKGDAQHH